MPTLNIVSIGETACQWYISDLSSAWNSTNYTEAYIMISGVGSSSPVYPPSSGTGYSTSWGWFSGLSPGTTYSATAYVRVPNGQTYFAASASFTTLVARPSNWEWWTSKNSGGGFNITAGEWDSFTSRVNAFRQYKFLSYYYFTSFSTGNDFPAYAFNQAVSAISSMSPYVSLPSTVYSGQDSYAWMFNGLRNSLNSI